MKNTNYKIICEEIESNNIILEDVITEGLIDNLKNMGKSALNGIANAANSMAEKFITGIASMTSPVKEYPYTGATRTVQKSDLTKLQTDGNTANNGINGSNYSFSLAASSVVTKQTTIMGREILELRSMVEGFES